MEISLTKEHEPDERLIFDAGSGLADGLFNSGYIPLIICATSGLWWSHQCGHYACCHPTIEGFVLSYNYCCIDGPKYHEVYNECGYLDELSEKEKKVIIKKINESLEGYSDDIIARIKFNDSRADELLEGFIPVLVEFKHFLNKPVMTGEELHSVIGTKSYQGYLCAYNCD